MDINNDVQNGSNKGKNIKFSALEITDLMKLVTIFFEIPTSADFDFLNKIIF